jgi:UDP-N-acetylmuramoyl-tripeptide--D-alanyl-D-alanine ligase
MMPLWSAAEAEAATGGTPSGDWQAAGVSIDSRTVEAGDLFIALAGPNFDGHDYVAAALQNGAAAALVSRKPTNLPDGAPLLIVADTQKGLEDLGRAARARSHAKIVAVTGSVGKTGTKEALKRAFERQGRAYASAGSLNNQWGVPLSLARMPRDAGYGVFELGMNHPGEIEALTLQVRPDIAIITNVEAAHLGFFPSIEAIADAKAEIFTGLDPQGAAILNRDNAQFERLAAAARIRGITRIIGFGMHQDAAVRLVDCHLHATASAVTALVMGEIIDYSISLPGRHWVMNSLAVLAAVKAANGDVGAAAGAMATLCALEGRGKRFPIAVPGGTVELIDDSYNANPASMRAAFAVLGAIEPNGGGRRIAVLGDMLELGAQSPRLHAELAAPLADAGIALVFTLGDAMRALDAALPADRRGGHAASIAELAAMLEKNLKAGDVVLAKGSHGSRVYELVAKLGVGKTSASCAVKG